MDNQNSVVNSEQKLQPRTKKPQQPQQPQPTQGTSGPEIWDGNSAGWTLVSYSRRKKSKK